MKWRQCGELEKKKRRWNNELLRIGEYYNLGNRGNRQQTITEIECKPTKTKKSEVHNEPHIQIQIELHIKVHNEPHT